MVKIAVGGQMEKQKISDLVKQHSDDEFEVFIKSDIEAALMVKNGNADYYFGCCATGGGGSLAGAIAILGYSKCTSISMPGKPPKEKDIIDKLDKGIKAFGFTDNHVNLAVPLLIEAIKNKK